MSKLYLFTCLCLLTYLGTLNAQTAYIPNNTGSNNIVSVVDLTAGTVVDTIIVETAPAGVAFNESAQLAYVTNELSASVSVISTVDHSVLTTIGVNSNPYGITLSADGAKAYIGHINVNFVTVINTVTNTVTGTIPVGNSPRSVTLSPDGTKLYVANYGNSNVSVIDVATDLVVMTITAGSNPNEVLVSSDNTTLYVANYGGDNISVIDAATGITTALIPTLGTNPYNMALTADGNSLYVTSSFGNNTVDVIDLSTNTAVETITVGATPTGIEITPDNTRMVVTNFSSDNLSIIDIATNTVSMTISGIDNAFGLGDFISGASVSPGAALDFDGEDDRVVLPSEDILEDITGDFTISAWVNIDDNTINQPVFSALQGEPLNAVSLLANAPFVNNKPALFINDDGNTGLISATSTLTTNEWHHILVTYDAGTEFGSIYVDGVLEGSGPVTDMLSAVEVNEAYLGFYPTAATIGGYFSGQMDEVRLTNTFSTCFDVEQQLDCELPADDPDLAFYYQFNQGTGAEDNTAITTLTATAGPVGTPENFALMGPNSNFVAPGGVPTGTTCDPVTITELTVTHTGSGITIADGDNTPSTDDGTDLGSIPVMNGASTTFQLNGENIDFADITSSNPLFTLFLTAEDLLVIAFTPEVVGTATTEITIATEDCSIGNLFTFALQGTGILLPGDVCSDAFDINNLFGAAFNDPQVSDLYDNTQYIANTTDPDFGYECFGEPDNNGGSPTLERTMWYTFTGDGNLYNITTVVCDATNYIDNGNTQMAVYSGNCATPLAVICGEDTASDNFPATVDLATEADVTYLMMIDGFGPNAPADGEYCVQVTNLTEVSVTDLAETALRVFPNPTTGIVQLPNLDLQRVVAYDATGRQVWHQAQPDTSIDLSVLPAGVYVLKLYGATGVYSAKVVKQF